MPVVTLLSNREITTKEVETSESDRRHISSDHMHERAGAAHSLKGLDLGKSSCETSSLLACDIEPSSQSYRDVESTIFFAILLNIAPARM